MPIPGVFIIKVEKNKDERGYFVETMRDTDISNNKDIPFAKDLVFLQMNESYSRVNTIRGLHLQDGMGKLVRLLSGSMIDLFLDTNKDSEFFGKIGAHPMTVSPDDEYIEWIWIPPGVAHGMIFMQNSTVEYFCTEEYNKEQEETINVFSTEIDWSLCKEYIKSLIKKDGYAGSAIISEKDRLAVSFGEWKK